MKTFYYILVCLCGMQRLGELFLSKRNATRLSEYNFAHRETPRSFAAMIFVHIGWFIGLIFEPLIFSREISPFLFWVGCSLFGAAQLLRYWAIKSLGVHWNVRVMSPDDAHAPGGARPFIAHGPYRYIRHPNYLAVIIEFISLPLVGAAYLTMVVFSAVNFLVLMRRIQIEEKFLFTRSGYKECFGSKKRLIPGFL